MNKDNDTTEDHEDLLRRDHRLTRWSLIRAFLALERYGNYATAAEMEGVNDATLRRRVQALEQHLGRPLFVRTAQGWRTASDQHDLLQAAIRMEEAARFFSRARQEGAGIIRITILDVLAQKFAVIFGKFQKKYPKLTLNITTELDFVNLENEHIDIAIRLARPLQAPNSLRIKKLGELFFNAYGSKAYLGEQRNNGITDIGSLPQLSLNLKFSYGDHDFIYRDLDDKQLGLHGDVVAWSDSFRVLARMCEQGLGIAVLPTILASDFKNLEQVYSKRAGIPTELWMISRFDLRADWQRDLAEMLQDELSSWNS